MKFTLQVLHVFYKIILICDIISFQHVLHFDVGRSEIEWNMKVIGASVSEPHLGSSTRPLSVCLSVYIYK